MKYSIFGATGIKVSRIALGSWYLPHESTPSDNGIYSVSRIESQNVVNRAIDLGINFFDTADVYRGVYNRNQPTPDFTRVGLAEQIVGEALADQERESLVIVTKVSGRTGPLLNDEGHNRKHIKSAIQRSLQRLKTDYVDIYLIHGPDDVTSFENTMKTMNLLIDEGKILHYGLSNFTVEQTEQVFQICKEAGLEPPSAVQDIYNLINRDFEKEEMGLVEKYNLGAMIYSPLAQGVLAGRYSGEVEGISRKDYESSFNDKLQHLSNDKILKAVEELSRDKSLSMASISLSWLMHKNKNIFPIIGVSNISQLEDSAGSADLVMGEEDYKWLELI